MTRQKGLLFRGGISNMDMLSRAGDAITSAGFALRGGGRDACENCQSPKVGMFLTTTCCNVPRDI